MRYRPKVQDDKTGRWTTCDRTFATPEAARKYGQAVGKRLGHNMLIVDVWPVPEEHDDHPNPHEEAARWRKVARMLAAILVSGSPDIAENLRQGFTEREWLVCSRAAGVKPPSEKTRKLLLDLLTELDMKEAHQGENPT